MSKRSIEVMIVTKYANGDEGIQKVKKLTIPKYIYNDLRTAEDKDDALSQHSLWVAEWIRQAIDRKEKDDEHFGIMDSW